MAVEHINRIQRYQVIILRVKAYKIGGVAPVGMIYCFAGGNMPAHPTGRVLIMGV